MIEIPIHPEMLPSMASAGVTDEAPDEAPDEALDEAPVNTIILIDTELKILRLCLQKPVGRKDILASLGRESFSRNICQALKRLKEIGLIDYTVNDKPSSKHQRYRITIGKKALNYLRRLHESLDISRQPKKV